MYRKLLLVQMLLFIIAEQLIFYMDVITFALMWLTYWKWNKDF